MVAILPENLEFEKKSSSNYKNPIHFYIPNPLSLNQTQITILLYLIEL